MVVAFLASRTLGQWSSWRGSQPSPRIDEPHVDVSQETAGCPHESLLAPLRGRKRRPWMLLEIPRTREMALPVGLRVDHDPAVLGRPRRKACGNRPTFVSGRPRARSVGHSCAPSSRTSIASPASPPPAFVGHSSICRSPVDRCRRGRAAANRGDLRRPPACRRCCHHRAGPSGPDQNRAFELQYWIANGCSPRDHLLGWNAGNPPA